jgi:hypothetical protein
VVGDPSSRLRVGSCLCLVCVGRASQCWPHSASLTAVLASQQCWPPSKLPCHPTQSLPNLVRGNCPSGSFDPAGGNHPFGQTVGRSPWREPASPPLSPVQGDASGTGPTSQSWSLETDSGGWRPDFQTP